MSSGTCRYCGREIFWFKSRNGKHYPCDSDNRRDFHNCETSSSSSSESDEPEPPPSPRASGQEEVRTMAGLVITTGFRHLAMKLHPDHGGRTHDMQVLNAAVLLLRRQVPA